MNKADKNKISPKKWLLMFLSSIVLGIIVYLIMVKITFKPDFKALFSVAMQILQNIGHPALKLKAYFAMILALMPLVVVIVWFLMPNLAKKEEYGNARFATREDFKDMKINYDTGLVLGSFIKGKKIEFLRATQPLSTLIVAPPGRGKTSGIIIPNLYLIPNTCIVYDIKGELFEKTAGYRQSVLNNEIQLFSPFSWDNTLFFNPFDNSIIKDMEYIHMKKLAEQIAGTIFVGEKGKENDHWIVSSKSLFVFFAEYFMQKNKHTTLYELSQAPKADYFDYLDEKYFDEVTEEDENTGEIKRKEDAPVFNLWLQQTSLDESLDENTRNEARRYITAGKEEFASIKSTFDTYMKVFANPQVRNATSKMSFSFEDLREKKITMYIVIQTEDMDVLAPLVRIFTETLFKKLMSGKECSDANKFIYCFLDEFVRFGKMPFLLEAPALCRSYGLVPVYVTQSYEQIRKYYGEDDLGIIRANAGYQVVFAMNTTKDAKEISELIGDYTREKISSSKGTYDLFKSNTSKSNEGYKLVTEQDIKNQSSDDLLILVGGFLNRPIKAKVPYWFKNEEWKGNDKIKVDMNEQKVEPNKEAEENKQELSKEDELKQLGITIINENDDKKEFEEEFIKENIKENEEIKT